MKEFLLSALPFIIIGICLAVIFANYKKEKQTYCSEGMSIGMCLGLVLSSSFSINMGLSLSLGMLIGETLGILIEKNEK